MTMSQRLELDSPRWSECGDAYGVRTEVPALLARLSSGEHGALDELYAAICHQGSVYGASFAAVPHLVEIAKHTSNVNLGAEILVLVGAIATSVDDRRDSPTAPDVQAFYDAALREGLALALSTLAMEIDASVAVYLLQAAAGLHGFLTLGRVLSGFVDGEFYIECPSCARALYVWPTEGALQAAAEDPVRFPSTPRTAILKGPVRGSDGERAYHWIIERGGDAALAAIGDHLPYLFGSGLCPSCGGHFVLLEELATATA